MDTASTSAAPAPSAGPLNGHDSPSDGNSAVDSIDTERSEHGAASSTQSKSQDKTDKPEKQQAKAKPKQAESDDDPEWDFGDGNKRKRSEVKKRLSEIQAGAQKAWKERQDYEKQVQARDAHLKDLGVDLEEFEKDPRTAFKKAAQAHLARELEEATLAPEEVEARRIKEERDELKQRIEAQEQEQQKQQYTRQVDESADAIAGHFATALQEHDLPANEGVVWRMASLLGGARKAGREMSLPELAAKSKEWVTRDVRAVVKDGGVKALKSLLEPAQYQSLREDIRKELLAEQQSKFPTQTQKRSAEPKVLTNPKHPNGYISFDEMMIASKRR